MALFSSNFLSRYTATAGVLKVPRQNIHHNNSREIMILKDVSIMEVCRKSLAFLEIHH